MAPLSRASAEAGGFGSFPVSSAGVSTNTDRVQRSAYLVIIVFVILILLTVAGSRSIQSVKD